MCTYTYGTYTYTVAIGGDLLLRRRVGQVGARSQQADVKDIKASNSDAIVVGGCVELALVCIALILHVGRHVIITPERPSRSNGYGGLIAVVDHLRDETHLSK